MKIRNILLAMLLIFNASFVSASVRNIQDNFKFVYNIVDSAGDHVTGQAPTVQIQRASDGYWFDFNDSTFKNAAWTNKTTALTEDSTNGLYYYPFNPPASETGAEEYVFLVDNADSTYGDHQSQTVEYQSIGTSTLAAADVWAAGTRTLTAGTNIVLAKGVGVTGFTDIAAGDVWDVTLASHLTAGTTGFALNAAGSAGDPWSTALPGAYGAGTAGKIVGDNLNATVSSRASQTSLDTVDDYVDTEVAAIKAKTDSLTFTTAGKIDARVFTNDDKTGYSLTQAFPSNFSSLAITAGGAVTAGTVSDKTGYSLTQSFPSNFSSLAITGGGAVTAGTVSDKTGYSLAINQGNVTIGTVTNGVTVTTNNDKTGYTVSTVSDKTGYSLAASQAGVTIGTVTNVTNGVTVSTNNDKTGYGLSAAAVDAVWDEVQSGHTTSGTFGKYLDQQVSTITGGGGSSVTAAEIADAVWDETLSGHLTAGSTGKKLSQSPTPINVGP